MGYAAVAGVFGFALEYAAGVLKPETVDSWMSYIQSFDSSVLETGKDIMINVLATPIAAKLFPSGGEPGSVTGVKSDIERALARTAAGTVRKIFAEWKSLDSSHRVEGTEQPDLVALDKACTEFLNYGGETVPPPAIKEWLEALKKSAFLDQPELGAAPWNKQAPGKPPKAPCKFAAYFQWRYTAAFRDEFRVTLREDEGARAEFSIVIGERLLDFAKSGAVEVEEVQTAIFQLAKELRHGRGALFRAINEGNWRTQEAVARADEGSRLRDEKLLKKLDEKGDDYGSRLKEVSSDSGRVQEELESVVEKWTCARESKEKADLEFNQLDTKRTDLENELNRLDAEFRAISKRMTEQQLSKPPLHAKKRRK